MDRLQKELSYIHNPNNPAYGMSLSDEQMTGLFVKALSQSTNQYLRSNIAADAISQGNANYEQIRNKVQNLIRNSPETYDAKCTPKANYASANTSNVQSSALKVKFSETSYSPAPVAPQ